MSRRYLTIKEAESTLMRGKSIEAWIDDFSNNGEKCIRWASFRSSNNKVLGCIWESLDQGDEDYLDIYSFDLLSGEYDKPAFKSIGNTLEEAVRSLGLSDIKFVNQGVIQDEYGSYLKQRT